MPRAIIQGDLHSSNKDTETLLSRQTNETEAIFTEGRSPTVELEHDSMSYIMFLIGYLVLEAIYRFLDIVGKLTPNSTEKDGGWDLETHSDIDAELHEMWELSKGKGRRILLAASILIFILFLMIIRYTLAGFVTLGIPLFFFGLVMVFITLGIPLLFFASLILSLSRVSARDSIMVESIHDISMENGYDEVLILCGDLHVLGIADELEEYGWETEPKRSVHPISKLRRMVFE